MIVYFAIYNYNIKIKILKLILKKNHTGINNYIKIINYCLVYSKSKNYDSLKFNFNKLMLWIFFFLTKIICLNKNLICLNFNLTRLKFKAKH